MDALQVLTNPSTSSREKRNTVLPQPITATPPQETTRSPKDHQNPPYELTIRFLAMLEALQHNPSNGVTGQQEKNLPLRDLKFIMIVIKYATSE